VTTRAVQALRALPTIASRWATGYCVGTLVEGYRDPWRGLSPVLGAEPTLYGVELRRARSWLTWWQGGLPAACYLPVSEMGE